MPNKSQAARAHRPSSANKAPAKAPRLALKDKGSARRRGCETSSSCSSSWSRKGCAKLRPMINRGSVSSMNVKPAENGPSSSCSGVDIQVAAACPWHKVETTVAQKSPSAAAAVPVTEVTVTAVAAASVHYSLLLNLHYSLIIISIAMAICYYLLWLL